MTIKCNLTNDNLRYRKRPSKFLCLFLCLTVQLFSFWLLQWPSIGPLSLVGSLLLIYRFSFVQRLSVNVQFHIALTMKYLLYLVWKSILDEVTYESLTSINTNLNLCLFCIVTPISFWLGLCLLTSRRIRTLFIRSILGTFIRFLV